MTTMLPCPSCQGQHGTRKRKHVENVSCGGKHFYSGSRVACPCGFRGPIAGTLESPVKLWNAHVVAVASAQFNARSEKPAPPVEQR